MNTTSQYPGKSTVKNDPAGHAVIAYFRKEATIFNLQEKIKSLQDPNHVRKVMKVALYGRLGKNNPNAVKYRTAIRFSSATYGDYRRIRIEDAATIDIYISQDRYMKY